MAKPGSKTQERLRQVLGFTSGPEEALDLRVEGQWEKEGLAGEELSWWVGYGPRTHTWVLKPVGGSEPLPALLALHDHGGFKYFGKEKIAEGPDKPPPVLVEYHQTFYGGRAYANALAREGYVVMIHDTFLWGSRKFLLEEMPPKDRLDGLYEVENSPDSPTTPEDIAVYNATAGFHEHTVEKYCNLLGTTMAGVVSHEDRIALNVLRARQDVDPDRIGCIGLSGGGNRSALLLATHEAISAAVIVGLMTTYPGLLDHNVISHTWMLFPHGWSRYGDWPDIAASRAPMPLLVQYDMEDDLFTEEGMRQAHARLKAHYRRVHKAKAYTGEFYPGPHKFDLEMQQAAIAWLKKWL